MESIVKSNAIKDPSYCPYCMRCDGLVRMVKVCEFGWRCRCGAQHDERDNQAAPLPPIPRKFPFTMGWPYAVHR